MGLSTCEGPKYPCARWSAPANSLEPSLCLRNLLVLLPTFLRLPVFVFSSQLEASSRDKNMKYAFDDCTNELNALTFAFKLALHK